MPSPGGSPAGRARRRPRRARCRTGSGHDRRPYALILSQSGHRPASVAKAGAWQSRVMVEDRGGLPPPPAPTPRRRRRRPLVAVGTVAAIVVVLVLLGGALIRLPYVLIAPGTANKVERGVKIQGAPTYTHQGQLLFLTVSVSSDRPNAFAVLSGWLD